MEDISNAAFWLALAVSGAATLLYWLHAVNVGVAVGRLAIDVGRGPGVASLEPGASAWPEVAGRAGTSAAWCVLALLAVSLVARWQAADHAPWSDMYEFTVAFAAGVAAFLVAFERVYERGGHRRTRTLGAIVMPVMLALLLAAAFFPSDVRPLVPALQNSDLLALHVAAMILAYGALSVSFGAAALYLVQGGGSNRFASLPKARVLDEVAFKSVMVGFPLLALGIALGAYWANSAWGRYWGWDPKETSALVTWLIYGIYLHTRGLRGWAGTRSAVVLVIGFAAVMFTYFAVNLWVSGLHSYGGV